MQDDSSDPDRRVEQYAAKLNQKISGCGGCTAAWEATNEMRTEGTAARRSFPRRDILKGIGTAALSTSVAASFLSGTAAADSQKTKKYDEFKHRKKAVRKYANDLLSNLAEDGILDKPSISEVPLRKNMASTYGTDKTKGTRIVKGDKLFNPNSEASSVVLEVMKHTEKGKLELRVSPTEKRSYAFLHPYGETSPRLYNSEMDDLLRRQGRTPNESNGGITTQAAYGSCSDAPCTKYPVTPPYQFYKLSCYFGFCGSFAHGCC